MKSTLSIADVHKGKVRIFKDGKCLGTTRSIPHTSPMNGADVRTLFNKIKLTRREKFWTDVCNADYNNSTNSKYLWMNMWKACKALQLYFKCLTLKTYKKTKFKTLVEAWGTNNVPMKVVISKLPCWPKTHIYCSLARYLFHLQDKFAFYSL